MKKRGFASVLLFLIIGGLLFAGGKKETEEKSVDKTESWQETFDIQEKKEGKYNIMVTAEDEGGNVAVAGPYNIFIDPDSDLPIAGITNPPPEMRVPGNLNIVGTCIDDDAVAYVSLVFDDDFDNPVRAEGQDFWSYYLDTKNMSEGKHKITVTGVDINGVAGNPLEVYWHLDRHSPKTEIYNYELGQLVSGKITLQGEVIDGNGIKSLVYSLDGENYEEVKLKYNKKDFTWTFNLPINTKDLEDGPQVCWFEGVDLQGTKGTSSFLFFVDNTAPDIHLFSPKEDEAINGIFSVAGSAYDTIGVTKMSYQLGDEIGDFELIAGNPYWIKEFDIRGQTSKTQELIITAVDKSGNTSVMKKKLSVDLEADLPVVIFDSPIYDANNKEDKGPVCDEEFYIRGSVEDDDGVSTIHWSVDNGTQHSLSTEAVFYVDIFEELKKANEENGFSEGNHTLRVWAEDIHQTLGKVSVIPFSVRGKVPAFGEAFVNEESYFSGMEVHPETNPTLTGKVNSTVGLNKISWTINDIPQLSGEMLLKQTKGETKFSIPLNNTPWGLLKIKVFAEDVYNRTTETTYYVYETNLSKVRAEPKVVFNDTTLESGTSFGYFVGGNAVKAEFVPETDFATVTVSDNTIFVKTTGKVGKSDGIKVKITTDKNLTYESEEIYFEIPEENPKIALDKSGVIDGFGEVIISGKVISDYLDKGIEFGYRFLSKAQNTVNAKLEGFEMPKFSKVEVAEDGSFVIDLSDVSFEEGITIIEMYAKSPLSKETFASVAVSKVSPLPEPDYVANPKAKPPVPANPAVDWIEGKQLYYTVYYQGELTFSGVNVATLPLEKLMENNFTEAEAGALSYELFNAGTTTIEVKVLDEKEKVVSNKLSIKKSTDIDVQFDSVDGISYRDGMKVTLPFIGTKEQTSALKVVAVADLPVTSIGYKISDSEVKKITPKKIEGSENQYEAYIPLKDLPAEITDIEIFAEADKKESLHKKGTICVIRSLPELGLNDDEKITFEDSEVYNEKEERLLTTKDVITGYVNVPRPFTAKLVTENEGLKVVEDGALVHIEPVKEGYYSDIQLVITDSQGIEYTTEAVNFWVDNENPSVEFVESREQDWLTTDLAFEINATDANEIVSVEYAVNEEDSWHKVERLENTDIYSANVSLVLLSEGLVTLDVRATDSTGKTTVKRMSACKDVTAPEIETIIPAPGDVINGETQLAFKVRDNGKVVNGLYILPVVQETEEIPVLENTEEQENPQVDEITQNLELKSLVPIIVGRENAPIQNEMYFRFTDAAGNVTDYTEKTYEIDLESDKPITEIHLPEDMSIHVIDFEISGIVYDDDGDSSIFYKIDDGEYIKLPEPSTSFSIKIPLNSLTDNEHTITAYAEDMFGVKGDEVSVVVRISLEEPKGAVNSPTFEETVKGRVQLSGVTSDKNGIDRVQVSVDNGNTWNDVAGTEIWSYEFDTRVIQDGTHVVFLRVWDEYQVQGLYSSLINIDNTAPDINLELPLDDSYFTTGTVFLSGQTTDNIGLEKLYLQIRNMDQSQPEIPSDLAMRDLTVDEIINQGIDVSSLVDGFYNIELTGEDAAGNITRVSRNIRIDTAKDPATLDLLYPLNGEHLQGMFSIYGMVSSEYDIKMVSLFVDGRELATTEVTRTGYYKFRITPDMITEGEHVYSTRTTLENGTIIYSEEQYFVYSSSGPWIDVSSFAMGDFAIDRPYLEGEAGYSLTEAEMLSLNDKETSKLVKQQIKAKAVEKIEISFDNGKTFTQISDKTKWRYRIENSEMEEGYHFMVVRAIMKNGEQAVTKMIIQIDKTSPTIKLISPGEGGRYNETIEFSGLSSDDVALRDLKLTLRSGDKSSYEVPAFIQGLYLDTQFWGATFYNIGAGLTFFDDNVKLQFQFGQFTESQYKKFTDEPMRYGGNVLGFKLLANIGYLPFSYMFGPDFSWLSASFALGANFSYFSQTQSGRPQILSALLAQIEFPRITLEKMDMFSMYSMYTELQIWSIPTDVAAGESKIDKIKPQISIGLRVNVF